MRSNPHHKHNWDYHGLITHSSDPTLTGKCEWRCRDESCEAYMYSERVAPAGKIEVRDGQRRFKREGKMSPAI